MNSIESNFVPYQISLDMKSIGFDEPCLAYWDDDKSFELNSEFLKGSQMDDSWLNTPTFSQAFRWFREKYDLYSHIRESLGFDFILEFVTQINGNYVNHNHSDKPINRFETYDEAEIECLKKLIELVKNED